MSSNPQNNPTGRQRDSVFHPEFREDLRYWIKTDKKITLKIMEILEDTIRNPFSGMGKPEPLKYLGPNIWSRRITQEHRLVYIVKNDRIEFLQARYHY